MSETLTIIISSSVIATILSQIVSFFLKRVDFKNEYYKLLIPKRMRAYEMIETQIALLRASVLDEKDQKSYHQVFAFGDEKFYEYTQSTTLANAYSIWLDQPTYEILHELMQVYNKIPFEFDINKEDELIKAGKKYYWEIGRLRDELEKQIRKDLLRLYDFKGIRKKIVKPGKQNIMINQDR